MADRTPQRASETLQRHLMRCFAKVGIVAMVDEATGYKDHRPKDALQQLLARYLRDLPPHGSRLAPPPPCTTPPPKEQD